MKTMKKILTIFFIYYIITIFIDGIIVVFGFDFAINLGIIKTLLFVFLIWGYILIQLVILLRKNKKNSIQKQSYEKKITLSTNKLENDKQEMLTDVLNKIIEQKDSIDQNNETTDNIQKNYSANQEESLSNNEFLVALEFAQNYIDFDTPREEIKNDLIEHEKFSEEAAEYAITHVDFHEKALEYARTLQEDGYSPSEIEFELDLNYTEGEIKYALSHLEESIIDETDINDKTYDISDVNEYMDDVKLTDSDDFFIYHNLDLFDEDKEKSKSID